MATRTQPYFFYGGTIMGYRGLGASLLLIQVLALAPHINLRRSENFNMSSFTPILEPTITECLRLECQGIQVPTILCAGGF